MRVYFVCAYVLYAYMCVCMYVRVCGVYMCVCVCVQYTPFLLYGSVIIDLIHSQPVRRVLHCSWSQRKRNKVLINYHIIYQ